MLTVKLNKSLIGNKFIALEVFTSNSNKINYAVTLIGKSKDEINIIDSKILDKIDFEWLLKQKVPISIILNTTKVLCKTLDFSEKNEILAFKKAFQTLNIDDFYFESFCKNGKTLVYMSRKDYVNEIMTSFKQIENKIINVSIGSSAISSIIQYIESSETICFNFGKLNLKQLTISSESIENETYLVSNTNLSNKNILGFSSIISFFNNQKNGNLDLLNSQLKNSFLQVSFFNKVSIYSVYIFLGILLLNYLIFSHYFEKYNELVIVKELIDSKTIKIESLSKNVYEKEQLLKNIGTFEKKPSFVINEINKTIPSSILLNELSFNPITKKQKDESLAEFEQNLIIISGITNDNEEFSTWLESLNKFELIKSTSIIDFGEKEIKINFTLKIKLDETKQ